MKSEDDIVAARILSDNKDLREWLSGWVLTCCPSRVYWCTGSPDELPSLLDGLVTARTLRRLSPQLRPDSYWASSDPRDVARVEGQTFICSLSESDAGPTNNWAAPFEMKARLRGLYAGSMAGRTMYVIPFSMGPVDSPHSRLGVQITDSAYVAASMAIMTRVGQPVLDRLGTDGEFIRCVHSLGAPLESGQADVPWPCDPENRAIAHFPETREIWSYGSGYGGNALLGKKCLALRIASAVARDEGWLAEHMMIIRVTSPSGRVRYFAGAFPSACGKTNLAMLVPSLPGWTVETIGDDIAWMWVAEDGTLRALNPESGFFGVAPGTSYKTNPNAMDAISGRTIFTNTALTAEGDVWWEGMTADPPPDLVDWQGQPWDPSSGSPAAHPNARFTVPASRVPSIAPEWEDPEGVPISGIFFGGRRSDTVPLIAEAFSWQHGVFMGSIVSSETTAAAAGVTGRLRRDPFAMLPFCGYNMADYFGHWLSVGERIRDDKRPRFFYVNWFRKGADGTFLWPGFGENSRVLAWAFERCEGTASAVESPVGYLPTTDSLPLGDLPVEVVEQALHLDISSWTAELADIETHYERFGEKLPGELRDQLAALRDRLRGAAS